jgi:hypothetical protein
MDSQSLVQEILQASETLAAEILPIRQKLSQANPVIADVVYYHPERRELLLSCWPDTSKEAMQSFVSPLLSLDMPIDVVSMDELDRSPHQDGYVKAAESPTIRSLGVHLGLLPGKLFGTIPYSDPTPLKSMLIGGLLGAGVGYGGGWAADVLADRLGKPGLTLRHKLPWLTGLMGAVPGAAIATSNMAAGLPANDNRWAKSASVVREARELLESSLLGQDSVLPTRQWVSKEAWGGLAGAGGLANLPPVDTTAFGQVVWGDPRVAGRLTAADQTALGTVVYGGANMPYLSRGLAPPSSPGWIPPVAYPGNMAKVLMGYGAGRLTAGVGAAAISSLFNLDPSTQEQLKNVGGFAGALQQVARVTMQP